MASVGTLRPIGLRRRLTMALVLLPVFSCLGSGLTSPAVALEGLAALPVARSGGGLQGFVFVPSLLCGSTRLRWAFWWRGGASGVRPVRAGFRGLPLPVARPNGRV